MSATAHHDDHRAAAREADRCPCHGALPRHGSEMRAFHARIVRSADEARRRIERDLHDGAQQRLVLLQLKLGLTAQALESDQAAAEALVREMQADLAQAISELRDLARGVYPPLLESDGLYGALGEAVKRSAVPAALQCEQLGRLATEVEVAVYFCCIEALQNAAKHAGANATVTIRLSRRDRVLSFEIVDDGVGFGHISDLASSGLQNMADRVRALGGELHVMSAPGCGTTVAGLVPID